MLNKKTLMIIAAEQVVLAAAPKIRKELRARKEMKSRAQIRLAWASGKNDPELALNGSAYDKYLDGLASFYETPTNAQRRYRDNLEFNKIIRKL